MQKSVPLYRSLKTRGFCTSQSNKIVASVLFERLPVVSPKIDPAIYAFEEFSFRWRQQYRRIYPDELLGRSDARGKGDYQIDFVPDPRITEADKTNDRRSLKRALDRRLYLLLYGSIYGAPSTKHVWHFPEKVYEAEETLRKCAESALKSVLGDLSDAYFIGNAPFAHMAIQPKEDAPEIQSFKYLDEKYPQHPLLPHDLQEKAINIQAANIVCSSIQPLQNLAVLKFIEEKIGSDERVAWAQFHIGKGFAVPSL